MMIMIHELMERYVDVYVWLGNIAAWDRSSWSTCCVCIASRRKTRWCSLSITKISSSTSSRRENRWKALQSLHSRMEYFARNQNTASKRIRKCQRKKEEISIDFFQQFLFTVFLFLFFNHYYWGSLLIFIVSFFFSYAIYFRENLIFQCLDGCYFSSSFLLFFFPLSP